MNSRDSRPASSAPSPGGVPSTASPTTATAMAPASAVPAVQSEAGAQHLSAPVLLAELADIGTAVSALAEALGVVPERLARAEALDRVELDTALTIDTLRAIPAATVTQWFAVLGDDLRLDLRFAGADAQESGPVGTLRAGRSPETSLASFLSTAGIAAQLASDDVRIEVRVALAKSRAVALARDLLAVRSGGVTPPSLADATRVVAFYTSAAWHRLVSFPAIADWERLGMARDDARTLVVLCDAGGYLAGPALEVLGARQDTEPCWLSVSPSAWRRFRDRAAEVRSLRDEEGSWPDAPRILTPAHLRVELRSPGQEACAARLAEMRGMLSAAYLASSVQQTASGACLLRFAGARPATCRFAGSPAGRAISPVPDDTATEPRALAMLATWAYAHASPDKLTIARECLARELPAGREVSLEELEVAASGALEAAKANFVLYLRGNTEQYFRVRQQALDAVSAYTAAVRKSVGDLTADVVDNVYRTVGLLAGVVIAALIQPSLSPLVTKVAAALYTLYMVFVLTYLLSARERRFQLESADLDAHLAAMPELSASERTRLRDQPAPERAYFERYFRISRVIYAALAALGLLLFLLLLWTPLGTHVLAAARTLPTTAAPLSSITR